MEIWYPDNTMTNKSDHVFETQKDNVSFRILVLQTYDLLFVSILLFCSPNLTIWLNLCCSRVIKLRLMLNYACHKWCLCLFYSKKTSVTYQTLFQNSNWVELCNVKTVWAYCLTYIMRSLAALCCQRYQLYTCVI